MATFGKRKSAGLDDRYARVKKPSDKRESDREKTYQNATILLADGSELECIVRDVSEGGCMVTAIGAESFPDMLIIKLGLSGNSRNARTIWRDQGACGLQFID